MHSHDTLSGAPRALLVGLASLALLGCGKSQGGPDGPSLQLRVAPLELVDIDYACYDIAVTNAAGDPVVTFGDPSVAYIDGDAGSICSWQFGNGAFGDIAYVAPCDADDGDADSPAQADNNVTIWFDGLYRFGGNNTSADPTQDQDVGGWQNPCPNGCTLTATCQENSDTEVKFDFTVMRAAQQGFFDIAVEFDDIFCSAKLDCQAALLHDGSGTRSATAVVGFACTAGENEETYLHLSDLTLTCIGGTPSPMVHTLSSTDLTAGQQPAVSPAVFAWASYQGDEQLTSNGQPLEKCYWNRAVGLDTAALAAAGVTSCTLTGIGTATETPTGLDALGDVGVHYPVIRWSVEVYNSANNGTLCGPNPLNGAGSGVTTEYIDVGNAASLVPFTGVMACGVDAVTCPAGPLANGAPQPVTVSQVDVGGIPNLRVEVDGASTDVPLTGALDGWSLPTDASAACCLHDCCAAAPN